MDPNTPSIMPPTSPTTGESARHPAGVADGLVTCPAAQPGNALAALTAAVDQLAAQGLDGLPDGVRAQRVLGLRRLVYRLEGHWLHELAAVDARGGRRGRRGVAGRLHC
jgi:hypothetical protein